MDRTGLALAFSVLILVGTVVLARMVPKGFIPSEDRAAQRHHRDAPREPASTRWWAPAGGRGDRAGRPQRGGIHVVGGRRAGGSAPVNQGRSSSGSRTASERSRAPTRSPARCTRSSPPCPACGSSSPDPAGDQHRRPELTKSPTSTPSQLRRRGAVSGAAALERRLRPGARPAPTSPATCRSRTRRSRSGSTATAPPRSAIDASQIENALYNAYGARQVSTIYTPTNQYWVMMELLPEYQRDLSALDLLYISGRHGRSGAALASLATITPSTGPLTVNHSGQLPSVTLSFNLQPGVSLGDAVTRVEQAAARGAALQRQHQLLGHGPGVPAGAGRACWRSWSSPSW